MSDEKISSERESKEKEEKQNILVGPGLGLVLLGLIYFIWYIMPFALEFLGEHPLAIHNWGFSIIFLTAGLGWYQKSVIPRTVVLIQTSLLPILTSGSFNPFLIVFLVFIVFGIFILLVLIERKKGKYLLRERFEKRTWAFLNMHLLIISWILIMHIGFVFLVQRAPQEIDLLRLGPNAGWLKNYTPEVHEISTWLFDLSIISWGVVVLYEQFKMGYNFQNNPWPRGSFYLIFIAIGLGLLGLLIQELTFGFDVTILDLIQNSS